MIPHTLRLKGISSAFPEEVTVDFDALGSGLIAVVGDNRAGKTHLIESCAAALYREFPSYHESVADHVAPGCRDAFIEFSFSLGDVRYRTLVQADPLFGGGRGKQEAYLFQGDTPLAGPLVRDFDQTILQILPPRELFLASVFACQGGGGSFFQLAKAERKDLFTAMLGVAHLQTQAEIAHARATELLTELARVRAALATAEDRAARVRQLETDRAALAPLVEQAGRAVAAALDAERAADQALAAARERLAAARAESEGIERDRARLTEERDAGNQRIGGLTAKLQGFEDLLADEADITAAVAELPVIDRDLSALGVRERDLAEKLAPITTRIATLSEQRRQLLPEAERAQRDLALAVAARERAVGATIDAEAAEWRRELDVLTARVASIDAETERLEHARGEEDDAIRTRERLVERREQLTPRTTLLAEIPGVPECASCPLTADARQAVTVLADVERELAALPVIEGTPARDALQEHYTGFQTTTRERAALETKLREAGPALAALAADQELGATAGDRKVAFDDIVARGQRVRQGIDLATTEADACRAQQQKITTERTALETRRHERAGVAQRASSIAATRAQRDEATMALATARQTVGDANAALAALASVDLVAPATAAREAEVGADAARAVRACAEATSQARRQDQARLEGERAALGDPAADVARLREQETTLTQDAADWTLLETALGRDGVQALELDAAGPSVTAIANDLLATCYGSRFQLALETTAQKKAGGQKEVFNIRIIDSEAGLELQRDSGGGMVILDEALRLALAIFNRQRSGFALQTLWRDETAGALSPENADRYVLMLRRALEIGGFYQIQFISHAPEVWKQADAQLFVGDGRVVTEAAAA